MNWATQYRSETVSNSAVKKTALGASANIPPRHMDFGFAAADFAKGEMSRHYIGNNPLMSAIITTLSAAIPEGERFFVESVRHFRHQITDPLLNAQVSGFIGQEAFHAKEHDAFNLALAAQGLPMAQQEWVTGLMIQLMRRCPRKFQLAATAALEHYTAIFAEAILRDPEMQERMAPLARAFWTWHAMEETEHKTVAFDVYEAVSGSYALRAGTMVAISAVYWPLILSMAVKLMADDGQLFKFGKLFRGLDLAFGRKGFFSRMVPQYLDYLKPGFHPSHHDTDALLAEWQDKLFGASGELNGRLKATVRRAA
jgi:predicted metal-dependent hydrolase